MHDAAVATSARHERGDHILDGRTGRPATELLGLTVVAPSLTEADATATAAFAMGRRPRSLRGLRPTARSSAPQTSPSPPERRSACPHLRRGEHGHNRVGPQGCGSGCGIVGVVGGWVNGSGGGGAGAGARDARGFGDRKIPRNVP
ncbi:FAD:protein FMN transferase [Streptodolium elevatio]|uniref:FAD:protein FMN transferase n=1 Tax=Streptodolium elevatio TaxID=3157996 RepID=UPI003F4D3D94